MSENKIYKIAKKLYSIYDKNYAPPVWAIKFTQSEKYIDYAKKVKCYTMDKRIELVKKILLERQPVNIGMNALYNVDLMVKTFGFGAKSGYSLTSTPTRLAPNIAVYCQTPVFSKDGAIVHVINSVGYAFDDNRQEDYKYFMAKRPDNTELVVALSKVYQMVFICAKEHNLHKIALSFVGGGAFSYKFPGGTDKYYKHIFIPALTNVLSNPDNNHVTYVGLLGACSIPNGCVKLIKSMGFKYKDHGFVPSALTDTKTLYQNAWDPHSIVGNGNAGDKSLDGFFGRSTAMGVLCFPPTNPYILIPQFKG